MSKQRKLIETIRQEEFGIGLELQVEAKKVVDNLVRKYRSLLSTVAEDLNSKDSHFILELIQNADDNSYESNIAPSLSFSLETNRLIVRNNEIGFEEKNVRALCSAGESSKKAEKLKGYIGEKGIGFKSIFKVTDSPEIHSNGYHFRFDRSNPDDLLGYVVPHWHEPDIQLDDRTTLVIPAKSGQYFTSSTLMDIKASLLLFLQKLRNLDVRTQDGQYNYQRSDNNSVTSLVTTKAGEAPTRQDFLRKSFRVDMSDIHEPKRKGVKETEIILAFPIDEAGSAAPILSCNTYAFLPIRDFGFKFYIQADFVLASSREDIHEDLKWNIRLRDAISDAFIEAIEEFKLHPEIAETYLRYIPNKEDIHNPFFLSVVEQLIEKLKTIECILVASGGWKRPADVLLTSEKIRELFPTEDAVCIFCADYINDDFTLPLSLKEVLDFKKLMKADVVSIFLNYSDWLKSKPLDWKAKFYAYLSTDRNYFNLLEKIPCIPLDDDSLVVPGEKTVFFPLSVGKKYGFEHELFVLNAELLKQATEISRGVALMFSELGVKHDSPFDLVQSHILRLHKDDKWKKSNSESLIGHVRYIKDKFPQYIEAAKEKGQGDAITKSDLKNKLKIGTKKVTNGLWCFESVANLYLGKEFHPKFDMERILEGCALPELFISSRYIDSTSESLGTEIQEMEVAEWCSFFTWLGVNTSPRVITESSGNIVCSQELNYLLTSNDDSIRRATLEMLDRNWVNHENHTTYQLKVGRSWRYQETGLVTKLKSVTAPTLKKVQFSLEETYQDNTEIRDILGDSVAFIDAELKNNNFLDVCGITYKLDATACLKRLRQLKTGNTHSLEQLHKIYRRLDALWDREHTIIENTFSQERLILVGRGEFSKWVLPKEVCWNKTRNRFLDQLYPSLSGSYQDFHGFFVKKLKTPEKISIRSWLDALKSFDTVSKNDRPELALAIYRQLNQDIDSNDRLGENSSNHDWMNDFDRHSLLLNQRGEMVDKSAYFYADDRPEISQLFDNEDGISFLSVSANQLPSVRSLLNKLKIPLISNVIEIQVSDGVDGVINNRLTAKLRDMLIPIAKIAYNQSHMEFEDAIRTGVFKELQKTNVLEAKSLVLTVTLGVLSRQMSGVSAARKNEIILDNTARSKHDYVAREVEKILLKQDKGISAHIGRVLMAESTDEANDYLEIHNILDLPDDKMKKLLSSIHCEVEPVIEPSNEETNWDVRQDGDCSQVEEAGDAQERDTGYEYNTLRGASADTHFTQPPTSNTPSHATTMHSGSGSSDQMPHPSVFATASRPPANVVSGQIKHTDTVKSGKNADASQPKSKPAARVGRLLGSPQKTENKAR